MYCRQQSGSLKAEEIGDAAFVMRRSFFVMEGEGGGMIRENDYLCRNK
jgi:hypothetical protein